MKHSCDEVYFSSCCCCAVLFVCVCERSTQRRNYPFYNAPRLHYCRDRVTKPKDFHWAAVGTHSNRHWSTARASTLSAVKRLNRSEALCCINTCISTHLYVPQSLYVYCQLCTSSPPSSVSKQIRRSADIYTFNERNRRNALIRRNYAITNFAFQNPHPQITTTTTTLR